MYDSAKQHKKRATEDGEDTLFSSLPFWLLLVTVCTVYTCKDEHTRRTWKFGFGLGSLTTVYRWGSEASQHN